VGTQEIELEPAEPDGFTATVAALPGLLLLGRSVDKAVERAEQRSRSTAARRATGSSSCREG
jgi:hypothetical protein